MMGCWHSDADYQNMSWINGIEIPDTKPMVDDSIWFVWIAYPLKKLGKPTDILSTLAAHQLTDTPVGLS